jgi:hypothetical protein
MNPLDPLTRLIPASLRSLLSPPKGWSEQARRLADALEVGVGELASIRLGPRYHYRPFTVAKGDGRERRILAPSPALKVLQRRLLDHVLGPLPVHDCATAFRPGFSIVYNARRHARQTLIATVDLRDFFESIRGGRVRSFFARQGWHGDALETLMRLCVYRDGLPQGAPTSPCLSNLVNVPLDERLKNLAERTTGVYTRYADDLTFSWKGERVPDGFCSAVEDCLQAAGYEIQPKKGWQVSHLRERPRVTGLVLAGGGRVRVPWDLRWRFWCCRWRSWWSSDEVVRARLAGYTGLLRMVK